MPAAMAFAAAAAPARAAAAAAAPRPSALAPPRALASPPAPRPAGAAFARPAALGRAAAAAGSPPRASPPSAAEAAAAAEEVELDAEDRMEKTLEVVQRSFATVRTGRANPGMLDRIIVDYYGAPTPLRQIAGVATPEAALVVVQPYDAAAIPAIERAIQQSDVGLTPNNDGKVIRLQVPQLTAERRKEMAKTVSKLGEEGKVAVRNVRRDAMKAVEKLGKGALGEDGAKALEDKVQKLTDEYVKKVEALIKAKSDELAKV